MDAGKRADEAAAIEAIDARRRRLRYRAWHRGTKEMDLVLGPYADAYAERLHALGLTALEALMQHADTDLLKWVMGQEPVPDAVDGDLLRRIVAFRHMTAAGAK